MDIALMVDRLIPLAEYDRADTYAQLARTWSDERGIPTESALEAEWEVYLSEQESADAYQAAIAAGYTAKPEDITFAITDDDLTEWTKSLTLLQENMDQLKMTVLSNVPCWDINGDMHWIRAGRMRQIIADLGTYALNLKAQYK